MENAEYEVAPPEREEGRAKAGKGERKKAGPGNGVLMGVRNPNKMNFHLYWRFSRGEYDLCADELNRWKLQSCKNFEFGHYLQALLCRKKGNINESLRYMKLCHLIDSSNSTFVKELSKTLCLIGKYKTAQNLIKSSPELQYDWELLEQLGDIQLQLREPEEAKESYQKALNLSMNKKLVLKLGKLYLQGKEAAKTEQLFNEYSERNLLDGEILEELGFMYLEMDSRSEALHHFGYSLPSVYQVTLSLGAISQRFGDVEGAIAKYQRFYAENQNSPEMWSNYGNCYLEKDIYISALSCFKRALFLNPLDWAIYYNLGLVYLAIKLYSVAFHYFLSSIKYYPQNSDGYMLLGITLNKLKDPANAYNAFDKACALAPDNHLTHLNMAIFLSDHLDQPGNLDICREKFDAHDRLYRLIQAQSVAPDVEIENQRNNLLRVLKQ